MEANLLLGLWVNGLIQNPPVRMTEVGLTSNTQPVGMRSSCCCVIPRDSYSSLRDDANKNVMENGNNAPMSPVNPSPSGQGTLGGTGTQL